MLTKEGAFSQTPGDEASLEATYQAITTLNLYDLLNDFKEQHQLDQIVPFVASHVVCTN